MFRKAKRRETVKRTFFNLVKGDAVSYRRTGIFFLKRGSFHNRRLAGLFLKKAMEKGDEKAYLAYHLSFSRKKQVIDDLSYKEIFEDYLREKNGKRRKLLKLYLKLGTRRQKKNIQKKWVGRLTGNGKPKTM